MNVSGIYFNGSANSFVVQEDVTFLAKRLPTATIRSVDSGGRDQTNVQLQTPPVRSFAPMPEDFSKARSMPT